MNLCIPLVAHVHEINIIVNTADLFQQPHLVVIIKGQLIKMLISCKCSLLHFSFPGWQKIEFAGSETIVFTFSKIVVFSSFNYVPFGLYIFYVCSIRRMQLTLLSLPKSFYNFFCSPLFVLFDLRCIVSNINFKMKTNDIIWFQWPSRSMSLLYVLRYILSFFFLPINF